ncbi:WecB/TagA/CpsF family glycosyltransferase [Ligilactobacillus equi]|uniref:N-acetylglucosaminyldiphosphoundecaprenol N-acetyl-beta-D-mannosaminyltransferase n=2 Tax=Ligilactobacillus equi TaxID=137357 RepID=V7HUM9_9LACO|nr:WecB/TagA/CpsF family glycosyltransferase [Ligilactobacillus equi]ETA73904.1 N-acetylglucosaminyldiphosphoundecaprenol N-acetyl-beta-D-mannosaminyltransferase [Ligilactobacillus equi DPC 6820]KRL83215.1 N-acetylglucosaminyldiphosphoundecaprenol N-acetyl-beta-D-mannosaminyltransferase [Ligilactobacillus equi DSM 15833 = JCM 10991]MCQ2557346.1 WecB/TagA/CpsF family glycosyltransferase [Ligilactobacillus sp.]
MSKFQTVSVLGVDFIKATNAEFLQALFNDSLQRKNRFVVTANPEIVLAAKNDPAYYQTLKTADYITADGIGIIKGAKILGTPLPERVTGYDTMLKLLEFANQEAKKVFLVGGKPDVIQKAREKILQTYPHIKIVGAYDGYFKDDKEITQAIAQSQPDFVFAALGFPKQENFIAKNRQLASAIWMGVGGSFDVLAGTVKRAPNFWIKLNLEWFYRLLKEPTRFKRMLALPRYLSLVKKEAKRQK